MIRIPAFFAEQSLVFDDGVFASSARAMRNGELPFRDIFSSQGPVFLPLVWVADLVGAAHHGRTAGAGRRRRRAAHRRGVRVARHVTSRRGNALLAAGLVTTSGSVLWVTVPVNADGPSLALSVLAVAFALRYRDRPPPAQRGVDGARGRRCGVDQGAVGAGAGDRGTRRAAVQWPTPAGVRDAAVPRPSRWPCTWWRRCPFGIADVWEQSYAYHQDSRRAATHRARVRKVLDTLWDRDKLVAGGARARR